MAGAQDYELPEGTSYANALALAKKGQKNILLDFYTDWCGYCKKMDATTFKDEEVKSTLRGGFLVLKVNAEKGEGPSLKSKFAVAGYPTFVIVTSSGEQLAKVAGYRSATDFNSFLLGHLPPEGKKNSDVLDFEKYIELKTDDFASAESTYISSLSFVKQQELKLARRCGEERNQFDYDELVFDQKDQAWMEVLDLEYALGAKKVDTLALVLTEFKTLPDAELLRYVNLMFKQEKVSELHLLWVNRVLRRDSIATIKMKELKLYALKQLGKDRDAKQYTKDLLKEHKGEEYSNGLKLLLGQ